MDYIASKILCPYFLTNTDLSDGMKRTTINWILILKNTLSIQLLVVHTSLRHVHPALSHTWHFFFPNLSIDKSVLTEEAQISNVRNFPSRIGLKCIANLHHLLMKTWEQLVQKKWKINWKLEKKTKEDDQIPQVCISLLEFGVSLHFWFCMPK